MEFGHAGVLNEGKVPHIHPAEMGTLIADQEMARWHSCRHGPLEEGRGQVSCSSIDQVKI